MFLCPLFLITLKEKRITVHDCETSLMREQHYMSKSTVLEVGGIIMPCFSTISINLDLVVRSP